MSNRKLGREEKRSGSAGWLATFGDLMNLLLCFFVLLFSMSNIDKEKFELVAASLASSINFMPAGSTSIGEGLLISSGISQLNELDEYISSMGKEATEEQKEMMEELETEQLKESEKLSEEIDNLVASNQLDSFVEVNFTSHYVMLTLSGSLLFDSGSADLKPDSLPVLQKIGLILEKYSNCTIEIEGHTDSVPISNAKFKNNDELSSFRALSVFDYFIANTLLDPATLKHSGRGEYVPIADNSVPEGRAKNRRVEIKIYHTLGLY